MSVSNNKKENFKRISENRVSKILVLLDQLTNLTNTSFYEYTDDDIIKIFDAIEKILPKLRKHYLMQINEIKEKRGSSYEIWYF